MALLTCLILGFVGYQLEEQLVCILVVTRPPGGYLRFLPRIVSGLQRVGRDGRPQHKGFFPNFFFCQILWPKRPHQIQGLKKQSPPHHGKCCKVTLQRGMSTAMGVICGHFGNLPYWVYII